MATFPQTSPDFVPRQETEDEDLVDIVADAAVNGSARARVLYSGTKRRFRPVYLLTSSALTTLETFFETNKALTFQYLHMPNNTVYTCIFTGPLKRQWRRARCLVTVSMRQA